MSDLDINPVSISSLSVSLGPTKTDEEPTTETIK